MSFTKSFMMFNNQDKFDQILKSREFRTMILNDLISQKNVVVTLTLNIPGPIKLEQTKSTFLKKIYYHLREFLATKFSIFNALYWEDAAGGIYYLSFNQVDPFLLKQKTLAFEDKMGIHARILDLDVYHQELKKIYRQDLKKPPRKCFLCNLNSQECIYHQNHSLIELSNYVDQSINQKINFKVSDEYIYDDILQKLSQGILKEGDHLTEAPLVQEYEVSRTIVRSTLKKLVESNLAVYKKNIGIEIQTFSYSEIQEIADLRLVYEKIIYFDILTKMNETKKMILANLVEMMKKVSSQKGDVILMNQFFNQQILALSEKKMTKLINARSGTYFSLIRSKINNQSSRAQQALFEHLGLCEALILKDEDLLEKRLTEHLENARENILRFYE